MQKRIPEESDRFYFYHSSFDPIYLIEKYAIKDQVATPNYLKNAFGVLIKPDFFPTILQGKEGVVEEIPIPANWHADIAEFGAVFRAIELSADTFTMIELGCGWGCWMNITGVVAKRNGKKVHLYGVEGDQGHVAFAEEALTVNGFTAQEYKVHHGIATAEAGVALFPRQDQPGVGWGEKPVFNVSKADAEQMIKSGKYIKLSQVPLAKVTGDGGRVDLLHVDIQGGERELIPGAINYLTENVAYLMIGTHSRQIEGVMHDVLTNAGWILEIERPAILRVREEGVQTLVDGVQGWRNPKLLPDAKSPMIANTQGEIQILNFPPAVKVNSNFVVSVKIYNNSTTDWGEEGRYPVRASYHWLDENGKVIVFDGERTLLMHNRIAPGKYVELNVNITAPQQVGTYKLQITIVQEGLKWFENDEFIPAVCVIEVEQ